MLPVREGFVQARIRVLLLVRLATLAGAVALAGCATSPPTAVAPADEESLARAAALVEAGDAGAAMALYEQLAASAAGPVRATYALAAARLSLDLGDTAAAGRWLAEARDADNGPHAQEIIVLAAALEIREARPEAALRILDELSGTPEPGRRVEALALRGRALFATGRVEAAIATFVEREVWLNDSAAVMENHELIWAGLLEQTAARPLVASGDTTVDGWIELAPVAAAYRSDPSGLERSLTAWRERYPNHPAADTFLPVLVDRVRLTQIYPERVALLLPLSSLGQQAGAIRDGFIAAHLRRQVDGRRTHIKVYDTDELGGEGAYRRAESEGAQFIVGPLLKPDVDRIVGSVGLTPTLALNFAQNGIETPDNFYQFALAPEHEALEVARHAIASGARRAVALIPSSDWGQRLLASFRTEFERLGGRLLEFSYYSTSGQDFSQPITSLLNITNSNQRRQRLAANLGVPLQFEPRRRQDVDMIFLATNATNGRLLVPQLRFHYAGDLPTYATGEIYGPSRTGTDADLDGILFPESPWLLSPDAATMNLKAILASYWPQRVEQWPRLFAMGFDAYRLIPLLYSSGARFSALPAMSGELSLDENGRVNRRLPVAQFRNGRPVPIGTQAVAIPSGIADAR